MRICDICKKVLGDMYVYYDASYDFITKQKVRETADLLIWMPHSSYSHRKYGNDTDFKENSVWSINLSYQPKFLPLGPAQGEHLFIAYYHDTCIISQLEIGAEQQTFLDAVNDSWKKALKNQTENIDRGLNISSKYKSL